MKKIQFYNLLFFLLFSSTAVLFAQQDTLPLSGITDTAFVQTQRLPTFGIGHHQVQITGEQLQRYSTSNLAQVLQLETTFFVKDYGPTGISTLSGRGGGAAHTAVLWEGFNIQSPMLGQADISLVPAVFLDGIAVQYGAESALFGNSSIGGAIHLQTQSKFGQGWLFWGGANVGSFGNLGQQFKLHFSTKHYAASARFFYKNGKNNFFFEDKNAFGNPKPVLRQANAQLEQVGVMTTHDFKYQKHTFGIKSWYQFSSRQIPPTLLQNSSSDWQADDSWRTIIHWKMLAHKQVWKARSALFTESLLFRNVGINSWSRIWSSRTEVENTWYAHRLHLFNFGINYSYFTAHSMGYDSDPHQHRAALFVSHKWTLPKANTILTTNIRTENVAGNFVRPAIAWGGRWQFYQAWYWRWHLSHNYRLPTFNDLYWNTLGNTNLQPEYSYNSEIGLHLPLQLQKIVLEGSLTGFCNLVNNWILWSPDNNGLWRPSNVDQVWARGAEIGLQLRWKNKNWQVRSNLNYAYTASTRTAGDRSDLVGKQLIYTPKHNANIALRGQYKKTTLLYQHSLTSSRFVDNTNTEVLPWYHFANLRCSQLIAYQKMQVTLYVQINNLYGANFQIIANRPMPWQQVEVGVQVDLK